MSIFHFNCQFTRSYFSIWKNCLHIASVLFFPFRKLQLCSYKGNFWCIFVIGIKINKVAPRLFQPPCLLYFTEFSDPLFVRDVRVITKAVTEKCSVKNMFLKVSQNSKEKHLCWNLFFQKVAGWRLFSCELWEIYKIIYFVEHLRTAASVIR